ncbi:MAG: ribosome-associated translation inhibitor RaiA [Firmicutes bacterium]|nr:ribosome-associated translation inhibitor RaiA [Bacillota bacterium]
MKTIIHAKNYVVSERLKNIIHKKIEWLDKYYCEDVVCTVVCSRIGKYERMEVTISTNGHIFRAQTESKNMYANIGICLEKIEYQIQKYKSKFKGFLRKESFDKKPLASTMKKLMFDAQINKKRQYDIKALTPDEAVMALDLSDSSFYTYAHKKTGHVNIIYKRQDGNIGIIELTNAKKIK